jgi:hypothetical protein
MAEVTRDRRMMRMKPKMARQKIASPPLLV